VIATSARLLRLITLLQVRREWSGAELAAKLGITTRTVRRDVQKLRDLGYPVDAATGIAGGYRLGVGAQLPPLVFDDEEAVAIALTLRTATGSGVAGVSEAALSAMIKIEQVLPSRLRHRVNAFQFSTVTAPAAGPTVDGAVLAAIGIAARDHQCLRFQYRGDPNAGDTRFTEPHELVTWGMRWYLVAWDLDRDGWRTFQVDRIVPRGPTSPRFTPREIPSGGVAALVARSVAQMWPDEARSRMHGRAPDRRRPSE
jgi:predicted DNA-binding transcriptional regulator YafY